MSSLNPLGGCGGGEGSGSGGTRNPFGGVNRDAAAAAGGGTGSSSASEEETSVESLATVDSFCHAPVDSFGHAPIPEASNFMSEEFPFLSHPDLHTMVYAGR